MDLTTRNVLFSCLTLSVVMGLCLGLLAIAALAVFAV